MSEVHFSQIDLNLLRVFDALLDERNVTRAGDRLGLSQSAVSHALGRLRQVLNDELFVRRSTGMEPTPRALEIGPALHTALLQMQTALAPAGFDPATTERRFSIAAGPYGCTVLLPAVVEILRQRAPGATLQIAAYGSGTVEALDTGRNDCALMSENPARRFRFQRLFTEIMVWVVRAGHPLTEGELTAQRLIETPHILVAGFDDPFDADVAPAGPGLKYRSGWDRNEHLNELARRPALRKVAVTSSDSIAALAIASRTDMAALIPRRLALSAGAQGRVAILPALQPPFSLEIGAVFREDRLVDPAVAWLSRLLAEAAAGL